MSYDTFLVLLMAVSVLTSLVTEAVKNQLTGQGKTYSSNAIAGVTSIILSVAAGCAYAALDGITTQLIIMLIALVLLSWLSAMVGYDKVLQAINQIRSAATTTEQAEKEILALTAEGLEEYTKAELKSYMDSSGIAYTAKMTKAELIAAILEEEG